MDLFDNNGYFTTNDNTKKYPIFDWNTDWDGNDTANVQYKGEKDGDWYKLSKKDGSATGFYLAELKCPNSYYDKDDPDNHYCAIEFRCYLDDSNDPKGFSYTLHDDC